MFASSCPRSASLHCGPPRLHIMPLFIRMYRGDTDGYNFVACSSLSPARSRATGLMTRSLRGMQIRPLPVITCGLPVVAEARLMPCHLRRPDEMRWGWHREHWIQRRGTRLPSGARSRCRGAISYQQIKNPQGWRSMAGPSGPDRATPRRENFVLVDNLIRKGMQ